MVQDVSGYSKMQSCKHLVHPVLCPKSQRSYWDTVIYEAVFEVKSFVSTPSQFFPQLPPINYARRTERRLKLPLISKNRE
jgi:hypothetical protein